MDRYLSFKHFPIESADREFKQSQEKRFKITTINWTYAGQDKDRNDRTRVHKNEYDMTLAELIDWIRDTREVAEDIINIEPLSNALPLC